MHVTIDGYGGDSALLANEELVRDLLERYPSEIGMTKIAPPHVVRYVGAKPEDWGVSGFVLIAESHISVHTFPERGYVWVDIFSCKEFEADAAIAGIEECFRLERLETHTLDRGFLEYPHEIRGAAAVADEERQHVAAGLFAPAGRGQSG